MRDDNTRVDARAAVSRFIDENRLLRQGDRVLVALSGGADSVALLHILISLKENNDIELHAAHFNHGIRGEEADRDERFVRELCGEWEIPYHCDRADIPALARESGESVELIGRKLRYLFLERVAHDLGGAKIATAHHRDDNAETVLWNLTRGAGISGLSGIPVQRGDIIRPLLCLSRDEIEDYCRGNDLRYVTDSTNLSDEYTRNMLRHQVMPVLRELNPKVGESIAQTSSLMREADKYLDEISLSELNKCRTAYGYSCEKLLTLKPIVLKYAVKKVLENADAPVDFRHIALIIEAMPTGGAVSLGEGFTASCAQGVLRVIEETDDANDDCVLMKEYIKTHGTRVILRGGQLYDAKTQERINNLFVKHCIPCDIITDETVFRTRRAGDTFTDARRGVTKTLKKLMNELKIPRELRRTVPVAAEGSVILWLQGYGTSAQAQTDLNRDRDLILLN